MPIWFTPVTPAVLNERSQRSMAGHLGIEFLEVGKDFLVARMPVGERTKQPAGTMHGGASVVLAETLGSVGATLCVDRSRKLCVGLEVNANHVRPVLDGYVYGTARPLHIGTATQVWEIRIVDQDERLVCISRLTLAVIDKDRQDNARK